MIYGSKAAFFSSYFFERLPSASLGVVQLLLFGVVDFFSSPLCPPLIAAHFAISVVLTFFPRSASAALSIYIERDRENRSCCWRLNWRAVARHARQITRRPPNKSFLSFDRPFVDFNEGLLATSERAGHGRTRGPSFPAIEHDFTTFPAPGAYYTVLYTSVIFWGRFG